MDASCIPDSGCSYIFIPLFLHFSFFPILKHYNFSSLSSQELWGLEGWNVVHTWTVGSCIMHTGIRLLLLIRLFIFHFTFSAIFKHEKFSSNFSPELWGLEGWNFIHTWTVGRCIVCTGIRLLLRIRPLISSVFFLSNFLTLKFFATLFSGTVRPRRLKLYTHVDSGQMYPVYRNQAAAAYSSLNFSVFFLSNFLTLKFFVGLEGWNLVHTWIVGRCI